MNELVFARALVCQRPDPRCDHSAKITGTYCDLTIGTLAHMPISLILGQRCSVNVQANCPRSNPNSFASPLEEQIEWKVTCNPATILKFATLLCNLAVIHDAYMIEDLRNLVIHLTNAEADFLSSFRPIARPENGASWACGYRPD